MPHNPKVYPDIKEVTDMSYKTIPEFTLTTPAGQQPCSSRLSNWPSATCSSRRDACVRGDAGSTDRSSLRHRSDWSRRRLRA